MAGTQAELLQPHCVFQLAKGKAQRRQSELILGRVQRYEKKKEAATMEIQIIDEENIHEVVKHGNRGPVKLWSLHT